MKSDLNTRLDEDQLIAKLSHARQALHCLYIAVDYTIAHDVQTKVEDAFKAYDKQLATLKGERHGS